MPTRRCGAPRAIALGRSVSRLDAFPKRRRTGAAPAHSSGSPTLRRLSKAGSSTGLCSLSHLTESLGDNSTLQLWQVAEVFFETVGPNTGAGFDVGKLRVDSYAALIALHRTFEHVADALFSDGCRSRACPALDAQASGQGRLDESSCRAIVREERHEDSAHER
jgi:hypothetical protein